MKTNTNKVIGIERLVERVAVVVTAEPWAWRHFPFQSPAHVVESRPEMSHPEELRRFAARLKQFNNEMVGQLTALHVQLAGLGQTWRDRWRRPRRPRRR